MCVCVTAHYSLLLQTLLEDLDLLEATVDLIDFVVDNVGTIQTLLLHCRVNLLIV